MLVTFHGGCADGQQINLPEPLLHTYRWPVYFRQSPESRWGIPNVEEYQLIPQRNAYYSSDHPEWQRYLRHCHDSSMQVAAEMAAEEKAAGKGGGA